MSLANKAVRGAAWTIITSVGGRAIGLVSTLVLTHFINPDEYGAVTVAFVFCMTAELLTRFGLFHIVVAKPIHDRAKVFHATFFHYSLGALGFLALFLLRHQWASWFASPRVLQYLPGMLFVMVVRRLSMPAERILSRDLRFTQLGSVRAVTEAAYSITAIIFGVMGAGGYAIVWGNVAQYGVFLLLVGWLVPWREYLSVSKLNWKTTKEIFGFGTPMAVGDIAHYASRQWDRLPIERLFGEGAVGIYSLAYNLADIPATQIGENIGDVLLPSFARLDQESRKRGLIRATHLLALVSFPLAVGLGSVAHTITDAIFNAKWAGMAPLLVVLSALSVVRPVGWTISAYQISRQQPRLVMFLEVGRVALLLASIWVLGHISILWACVGVGVAYGAHALACLIAVRITDGVPFWRVMAGLGRPLLACIPMGAAVLAVRYFLVHPGMARGWLLSILALQILVGGVVYAASAWVLVPETSRDFLELIKKAVLKRGKDREDSLPPPAPSEPVAEGASPKA